MTTRSTIYCNTLLSALHSFEIQQPSKEVVRSWSRTAALGPPSWVLVVVPTKQYYMHVNGTVLYRAAQYT